MKTLFIIRGFPGSGKTTLARIIAPKANAAVDDFMVNSEGEYTYDPTRLTECHELCRFAIQDYMREGVEHIAVHNTFTRKWEMTPYVEWAAHYGYSVHVITCHGQWQNVHNVPPRAIQRMCDRWED